MTESNLYPLSSAASRGPGRFFGRRELLLACYRFLEHPLQKMLFIDGPRRIGKTSLLRKLKNDAQKRGFLPVFFNLHGQAAQPLPQVLYNLTAAINGEIHNTSLLSIDDFKDDYHVFDTKFLPSISHLQGKLALLIDEFDALGDRAILQEDPALQESAYLKLIPYLHTLLEKPIAIKCIFAVGRSPSDLSEYYEPVKKVSAYEQLEGFGLQDTTDLIASQAADAIRFTDAAVEEIQRLTKGYPPFVECLAKCACDHGTAQQVNEIDKPDIESQLITDIDKYGAEVSLAVDGITPLQRSYCILTAKLRERGHIATEIAISLELQRLGIDALLPDSARGVSGLLDAKILVYNPNFSAYSFFAPLVEHWFARTFTIQSVKGEIGKIDGRLKTIEDRKKVVKSFFDLWRPYILDGNFEPFQSTLKSKPWLLKEYQSDIIQFIDELISEMAIGNPFLADDFSVSLKGSFDDLQMNIWRLRIENRVTRARNAATEIQSMPEATKQAIEAVRQVDKPPAEPGLKLTKRMLVTGGGVIVGALLLLVIGFAAFHHPRSPEISAGNLQGKNRPIGELQAIFHDEKNEKYLMTPSKAVRPESSAVALQPSPKVSRKDSLKENTAQRIPLRDTLNDNPIKNEARIMLINASSMLQKGMAAQARARLINKGFPASNILVGTHADKVSKVYAYYNGKQYITVIKEIFADLYPKKEKSFIEISSKDRTVNGWILRYFHDERLQILIRMPNEE